MKKEGKGRFVVKYKRRRFLVGEVLSIFGKSGKIKVMFGGEK